MAKLEKIILKGQTTNFFGVPQEMTHVVMGDIQRKQILKAIRYVEKHGHVYDGDCSVTFVFGNGAYDVIRSTRTNLIDWEHQISSTRRETKSVYASALKDKSKEWLYEQY